VAARRSVAPGANVRPAPPLLARGPSRLKSVGIELPTVRMKMNGEFYTSQNISDGWISRVVKHLNDRTQAETFFIFLEIPPPGKCSPPAATDQSTNAVLKL